MEERATTDPELFELVHRLLEAEKRTRLVDRRDDPRHLFRVSQLVAFYTPPQKPNAAAFQQVEFEDLSAQGVSFFLSEPPAQSQVVIALGDVPFTFLIAEMVSSQPIRRGDELLYRIGCRFIGRMV